MDLQALTDQFAIPGVFAFDQTEHGLIRAAITTPACTAELYLQGAHLTQWQPAGQEPVLFLSARSLFEPGKPIRGGVPIIFPWFGPRTANDCSDRTDGPMHGFARTQEWTLAFAALAGDDLHLTLTLGPSDVSRAFGFDHFQLACNFIFGAELRVQLTVANQAETPLCFEETLHTYLNVGDAQQIEIIGLSDTEFIDKTDEFKRKRQKESPLCLTGETDRPYLNTKNPVNVVDPVFKRRVTVDKSNSRSTVVWNPWSTLAARLADMEPTGWLTMTCIETANVADNRIKLAPGDHHIMEGHIFVEDPVPVPAHDPEPAP
jgi:glucose-6-phosphate 1-epimerase